jgi:hypothetical protein
VIDKLNPSYHRHHLNPTHPNLQTSPISRPTTRSLAHVLLTILSHIAEREFSFKNASTKGTYRPKKKVGDFGWVKKRRQARPGLCIQ